MFNKNDPLISSVQKVMEENARRRDIEQKLCEELGIYSRKQLPHEHQVNYDALLEQRINEALHPNQQKLDVHEPEKDKLTAQDFKMLRAGKKNMKEAELAAPETGSKGPSGSRSVKKSIIVKEEGEETREGGAVVDTKTNKPVVSSTASQASGTGPSQAERSALTNKIKQMKEAMLAGAETGPRKTPGSNQMAEETQLDEKAVSKAQHRFFGLVRAIQKGKAEGSEKAEKAAKKMSVKSVRDYAKTKEKGLPEKKKEMKESITLNDVMEEIKRKLGDKKMKELDEVEGFDADKHIHRLPLPGAGGAATPEKPIAPASGSGRAQGREGPPEPARAAAPKPAATETPNKGGPMSPAERDGTDRAPPQTNQPPETVATKADRDAFRARTGSTVDSSTGQVQANQPPETVATKADRDAFRARTGSTVGAPPAATPEKPIAPASGSGRAQGREGPPEPARAAAPKPAAPTPPSRPTSGPAARQQTSARPQATAPSAPTPPDYSSSDDWGGRSSSSFFAQDRARQQAGKVSGPYNPMNRAPKPAARAGLRESLETTIKNIIKG